MEADDEDVVSTTLRRGGTYTLEDLLAALKRVNKGEKYTAVSRTTNIPLRTLFKKAREQREGKDLTGSRRGTKPTLPMELEEDLVEWVSAMQRVGLPVGPSAILAKANEVYMATLPMPTRSTVPTTPLTAGWYRRFIGRHPQLTPRVAQQIARVRNNVDAEAVRSLFYTLAQLVIEHKLDKSRVFNMDETAFMPKASTRKVVALKGSSNVWTQEAKANFHMTVVAAVNAAGDAVPPLIILPGQRIHRDEMAAISIDNTTVTGAPKGFSNTGIFKLWMKSFDSYLTNNNVKRPVVLVLDNSSTHVEIGEVSAWSHKGILLVGIPPNSTHLYQPLDVAVFKPFKVMVKSASLAKMLNSSGCIILKSDAIEIACHAFRSAVMRNPINAVNGFRTTGIYPPSLPSMQARLRLFASGGARGDTGRAVWLKRKAEIQEEIRSSVLQLPPAPYTKGKRARRTVDFVGRLITKEMLLQGEL